MTAMVDVAIVGAGPAGLATAIACAESGLETLVLERHFAPPDKACGEGLMPRAVRALRALGVVTLIDPARSSPIEGIRFVQEDGAAVEARFPADPGLTVRRTALVEALRRRAAAAGATLHFGARVRDVSFEPQGVRLRLPERELAARMLIAADGLHSPLRRLAGLARAEPLRRRFGLRRHFVCRPWTSYVEVHWSDGCEAYVTPVGPARVGVAFLFSRTGADALDEHPPRFERMLQRFPALAARLAGCAFDSTARGAGPLEQLASDTIADRLVLVGDAAGYVDAITGEGMTLAFESALALGALLPRALRSGATARALEPYRRQQQAAFARYALYTRLLLLLASHPRLRRELIEAAVERPALFDAGLGYFTGELPPARALARLIR